ncbi:MAG: AAA family ATPase [Dehalococcoidia bacterium]
MKSQKIAITGKGGSGKTAITAILTGLLAKEGKRKILAIDADSSVSLSYALGIAVKKTVSEIRRDLIEDPHIRQEIESRHIRDAMADIVEAGKGFDMLTMGRPEGPGCFCATNELLRYGIDSLSRQYDITLIDCEAGPEQVNRRVVNGVDFLIIVTDTSQRGMYAAIAIDKVVRRGMDSTRTGLIINKSTGMDQTIGEIAEKAGLEIVGTVPNDEDLAEFDSLGKPIIDLPENSPGVQAISEAMGKMTASLSSLP